MPLWDDEKDSIWMLPGYLDGIKLAGGLPVVFPFTEDENELEQLVRICDGLLFTGGHDVSPVLYHEEPMDGLVYSCKKRDVMESIVLGKAIEKDKPVLGICRGIQFINVFLGGTLYQDIPTQFPSGIEHHQTAPYDKPAHDVSVVNGSPLSHDITFTFWPKEANLAMVQASATNEHIISGFLCLKILRSFSIQRNLHNPLIPFVAPRGMNSIALSPTSSFLAFKIPITVTFENIDKDAFATESMTFDAPDIV